MTVKNKTHQQKKIMYRSVAKTIQSQTMRKLNPMNRPSTPPQSATRKPNEKASSSFKTCTGEEYINHNMVPPCLFIGAFIVVSSIFEKVRNAIAYKIQKLFIPLTLYSINEQGIKHPVSVMIPSLSVISM